MLTTTGAATGDNQPIVPLSHLIGNLCSKDIIFFAETEHFGHFVEKNAQTILENQLNLLSEIYKMTPFQLALEHLVPESKEHLDSIKRKVDVSRSYKSLEKMFNETGSENFIKYIVPLIEFATEKGMEVYPVRGHIKEEDIWKTFKKNKAMAIEISSVLREGVPTFVVIGKDHVVDNYDHLKASVPSLLKIERPTIQQAVIAQVFNTMPDMRNNPIYPSSNYPCEAYEIVGKIS